MSRWQSRLSILLCSFTALLIAACGPAHPESLEASQQIAEEFAKMETTFRFDGLPETLKMTGTTSVADGWQFTIEYDSSHSGYGNRTGQILAQVITRHTAKVTVKGGRVVSAIMDGRWDMISQRLAAPASSGDGFAIYLLAQDIPVASMSLVSRPVLADAPLVSLNDVVSYRRLTHEMELSPAASERLFKLDVPTSGRVFVVCVDGQPVYWGAFWTPISSQSFDGVTIVKPLSKDQRTVRIDLGYPAGGLFTGADPRSDPEVLNSLRLAKKVKQ